MEVSSAVTALLLQTEPPEHIW